MTTHVSPLLNASLEIYYQFLTKGEVPNVKRVMASPKNWSEFLMQVKGQMLDYFTLLKDDPDAFANDSVELRTRNGITFVLIFRKTEGEWVLYRIDWYRDPKNGFSIDHCW
jgi:hypothetical protein